MQLSYETENRIRRGEWTVNRSSPSLLDRGVKGMSAPGDENEMDDRFGEEEANRHRANRFERLLDLRFITAT
jgi:hypothetical protein